MSAPSNDFDKAVPANVSSVAPRVLGLLPLTALVTGNMIGSGIFLLPATLAGIGSISILGWLLTASGALLMATIFARLGYLLPQTGGAYAFCREAFGKFVAFQVVFNYWIQSWVGNAAIVLAFVGYISFFYPPIAAQPLYSFALATATLWFLTFVNSLGLREAGWVQILTTFLKLLPLLVIIVVGVWSINTEHFSAFNQSNKSDFFALMDATTLTLWSFIGLEAATIPAGSAKDPQRNIPRATIYGTLIAAVFYLLSTVVIFGLVPLNTLASSHAPYADAARLILGQHGAELIALGAAISAFGALNGWILVQAQMPFAAARDGLFPQCFAKLNKRGVPIWGLLISSSLITVLLLLNFDKSLVHQFKTAILMATLSSLIPYVFTMMAYFLIRRKYDAMLSKKQRWFYTFAAIFGFIYGYFAICGAGAGTVYYGMILLFGSLPLYAWLNWRDTLIKPNTTYSETHV